MPLASPVKQFPHRLLRRAGCLIFFLLWLVGMTLPCVFITLLVQKDITVSRSSLPDHYFRLFLVEGSADNRGLGISRGDITDGSAQEGKYCIKTSVTYWLWQGQEAPLAYCGCYERIEEEWLPIVAENSRACKLP